VAQKHSHLFVPGDLTVFNAIKIGAFDELATDDGKRGLDALVESEELPQCLLPGGDGSGLQDDGCFLLVAAEVGGEVVAVAGSDDGIEEGGGVA
jgi:hypothetical protein